MNVSGATTLCDCRGTRNSHISLVAFLKAKEIKCNHKNYTFEEFCRGNNAGHLAPNFVGSLWV
jgi:hypothetical protein